MLPAHPITRAVLSVAVAGGVLLLLLLSVDAYGVRVASRNGLGFDVHCYSYGSTYIVAALVFGCLLLRCSFRWYSVVGIAMLSAAVWWGVAFAALVRFHIAIGGTL